jgi:hypothetical protein
MLFTLSSVNFAAGESSPILNIPLFHPALSIALVLSEIAFLLQSSLQHVTFPTWDCLTEYPFPQILQLHFTCRLLPIPAHALPQ